MKRLHDLNESQILERQSRSPSRNYFDDPIQNDRVVRARVVITRFLKILEAREPQSFAHTRRVIAELGTNSGDISGYFSWGHFVHGWEISPVCVAALTRKYPWIELHAEDFTKATPIDCDLLILCECLEHIPEPAELCARWMPHAKYCLLSSPLEGDLQGDASGGEHVWSFTKEDFANFVKAGGHVVKSEETFKMGCYTIHMLLTERGEADAGNGNHQSLES